MTDELILFVGMFCFAMTVVGIILTANEFRKM
jgi:hypothetical protein